MPPLHTATLLCAIPLLTAVAVVPACKRDREKATAAVPADAVDPTREILITSLDVVEDPARTIEPCAATASYPSGARVWSFGYLMTELARSQGITDPVAVSGMVLALFQTWNTPQTIPGTRTEAPARPRINKYLLNPWVANSQASGHLLPGQTLDLNLAPFRLLAISNRIDQRGVDASGRPLDAGGARFVFGAVHNPSPSVCARLSFTLILEYKQLAASQAGVDGWARAWHGLRTAGDYNGALAAITARFSAVHVEDGATVNPVLTALRTNEVAIAPIAGNWEMREFTLGPGGLSPAPTAGNPDVALADTPALGGLIDGYDCKAGPLPASQQGGFAPNLPTVWSAPDAGAARRHQLALNATCAGCHNRETGTAAFTHVMPRDRRQAAGLSSFLTGCAEVDAGYCPDAEVTVPDPVYPADAGVGPYTFNELRRRADYLHTLLTTGTNAVGGGCVP